LINEVQSGEALIKSLNERNIMMEKNLREAVVLEDGYKELIKSLKLNPPYVESHVQSLEVEVSLADKQFDDLCQQRAKLYQESVKLEEVKKKHLMEKISYFKNARAEIQAKKKTLIRELKHLKDSLGKAGNPAFNANNITDSWTMNGPKKQRKTQLVKTPNPARSHRHSTRKGTTRRRDGDHSDGENEIIDSSDSSDSEVQSTSELQLTKPVMHFINAIVRKVTYNEAIIKETDETVLDVKKRAAAPRPNSRDGGRDSDNYDGEDDDLNMGAGDELLNQQENNMSRQQTPQNNLSSSQKKKGRISLIQSQQNNNDRFSDGESISSNTSLTRLVPKSSQQPQVPLQPLKKRLTADQVGKLRSVVKMLFAGGKSSTNLAGGEGGNPISFKAQIQKAVHLIFQKTESNTYEEFIERFTQDQQLLEQLKSQQVLVDSRLAQLRAEHAELYAVWSDISFLAEENNAVTQSAVNTNPVPGDDSSDRYLDNQLFVKEVRMHHYQRLGENSIHTIAEARLALGHLMRLLVINSKLLSNLPRTVPPELNNDNDMAACLSWCEDRLIALNEALTMDANRPNNNTEENKPIAQRQTELASLVHSMNENKRHRVSSSMKGQRKQQGAMSKGLINAVDSNILVSSPRGVMVSNNRVERVIFADILSGF
jgi:hypothetical protein